MDNKQFVIASNASYWIKKFYEEYITEGYASDRALSKAWINFEECKDQHKYDLTKEQEEFVGELVTGTTELRTFNLYRYNGEVLKEKAEASKQENEYIEGNTIELHGSVYLVERVYELSDEYMKEHDLYYKKRVTIKRIYGENGVDRQDFALPNQEIHFVQ